MFGKTRRNVDDRPMALNITSLMDILTIVLIFLVMSFSSDKDEVGVPKDFSLPSSNTERPVIATVKISIGHDDLRVEDTSVAKLRDGKIPSTELDKNKHIEKLLKVLRRHKAQLQSSARSRPTDGEEDKADVVYLEAAKGLPFGLVDRVLKTAATAGFSKFRLAVQRRL